MGRCGASLFLLLLLLSVVPPKKRRRKRYGENLIPNLSNALLLLLMFGKQTGSHHYGREIGFVWCTTRMIALDRTLYRSLRYIVWVVTKKTNTFMTPSIVSYMQYIGGLSNGIQYYCCHRVIPVYIIETMISSSVSMRLLLLLFLCEAAASVTFMFVRLFLMP